jgi:ankyrin repeat protein
MDVDRDLEMDDMDADDEGEVDMTAVNVQSSVVIRPPSPIKAKVEEVGKVMNIDPQEHVPRTLSSIHASEKVQLKNEGKPAELKSTSLLPKIPTAEAAKEQSASKIEAIKDAADHQEKPHKAAVKPPKPKAAPSKKLPADFSDSPSELSSSGSDSSSDSDSSSSSNSSSNSQKRKKLSKSNASSSTSLSSKKIQLLSSKTSTLKPPSTQQRSKSPKSSIASTPSTNSPTLANKPLKSSSTTLNPSHQQQQQQQHQGRQGEGVIISGRKRAIPYSAINTPDRSGRTPIFKFITSKDIATVVSLIEAGADVNVRDHAGWTPLHEACLEGQKDIVDILVKYGADVNAQGGTEGDTPLHDAVSNGHVEVVEALLGYGAGLLVANRKGVTVLDVVENELKDLETEREDRVKELKRKGKIMSEKEKEEMEEEAQVVKDMQKVLKTWKEMLEKVRQVDEEGMTMLQRAVMKGDLKEVEKCLKYGADACFGDLGGWTPLHEAAQLGHLEIAEVLLKFGGEVDARGGKPKRSTVSTSSSGLAPMDVDGSLDDVDNPRDVTPLMDASAQGHFKIVELLLSYGARTDFRCAHNRTAVDYAQLALTKGFIAKDACEKVLEALKKPKNSWEPFKKSEFSRVQLREDGSRAGNAGFKNM